MSTQTVTVYKKEMSNSTTIVFQADQGTYQEFSNTFPSGIEFQNLVFSTVEHLYQVLKYRYLDSSYAQVLIETGFDVSAIEFKKMASKSSYVNWCVAVARKFVNKYEAAREFDARMEIFKRSICDDLMLLCLLLKFTQNLDLSRLLISTGTARLEERGKYSTEYWTNKGANRLGRLLEDIRNYYLLEEQLARALENRLFAVLDQYINH